MPINAVEKPLEETKPEDSASSDSDDDDSPPELEEHDAAAMHQRSEVRHCCCFFFFHLKFLLYLSNSCARLNVIFWMLLSQTPTLLTIFVFPWLELKFHLKLPFRIHTREAARYRRTPLGVVRRTCADVFGIALHIGLSPLFSVVSLCVGCFSRCSVIILDWVYNCPVVCLATLNNCAIVITSFITLLYNFVIIVIDLLRRLNGYKLCAFYMAIFQTSPFFTC